MSKPFAAAAAIVLTATLAACGGGGDEDPQEVLDATFSNQQTLESGVFEISLSLDAEGGENEGSADATLGGPFDGAGEGFPSFDIQAEGEVDTALQDASGTAGLTSTGDAGFVSFQDTAYAVPAQVFNEFATTFTRLQNQQADQQSGDSNFLSSLGVDPTRWLTDVSNEGDEDVEGTETVHISGTADVPALIEDLKTIAENAPEQAQQVTPQQLGDLDELNNLIEGAEFDIYSGKDDDILRRLDASIDLAPGADALPGAPDDVTLDFSITFSDLNEPQEIAAPADPQPIQGLVQQFEALGQLGGGLSGGGASGGGGGAPEPTPAPSGGNGGGGAAAPTVPPGPAAEYLECLAQGGPDAVEECESLRP